MAPCFFAAVLSVLVAMSVAQTTLTCGGRQDGDYGNPNDCGSFIKCANNRAYRLDCPPGTLYDEVRNICDRPANVNCGLRTVRPEDRQQYPRIVRPSVNQGLVPAVQGPIFQGQQVTTNVVRVPMFNRSTGVGPSLPFNSCTNVSTLLNRYLITLVASMDPVCSANSACMASLPTFVTECLA